MLTRADFVAAFTVALATIAESEGVTKREFGAVSRTLLSAIHGLDADALLTGDVQFINALLPVLSTVHRMAAVEFFKEFSGFHYDGEALHQFTKKSAKTYAACREKAVEALKNPAFDVLSWTKANRSLEPKPYSLDKVTTAVAGALKKVKGIGKTRGDVLRAVFAAGFTMPELVMMMQELDAEAQARDAIRQAAGGAAIPPAPALM